MMEEEGGGSREDGRWHRTGAERDREKAEDRSWARIYTLVVAYGIGMILALILLTRLLDPGAP
jgi:hypothetical protein